MLKIGYVSFHFQSLKNQLPSKGVGKNIKNSHLSLSQAYQEQASQKYQHTNINGVRTQ